MPETLLSPSNVLLYGRVIRDFKLDRDELRRYTDQQLIREPKQREDPPLSEEELESREEVAVDDVHPPEEGDLPECELHPLPPPPPRLGSNNFLQAQLLAPGARLARIYGFSYEGHYYDLAKPAIFLVHGPGSDPEAFRPAAAGKHRLPEARVDRAPSDADRSGVARTGTSFAEDMRVWSYDKGDFSIRLDPETGPLEQILLQAELQVDRLQTIYSGNKARLRPNRGGGFSD